jgi:putative ABC transport system substrate-binding protein
MVQGFRQGLENGGFHEGKDVVIEYRWAHNQIDRLPALAQEIVALRPRVIAATGGSDAIFAAKAATSSVPIVFVSGADPVETGVVTNLNHPEGNITGVTFFLTTLLAKRFELLREAVPNAKVFGFILNPNGPDGHIYLREIEALQTRLGQDFVIARATSADALDAAFAHMAAEHVDAIVFAPDPFFFDRRDIVAANVKRLGVPAIGSSFDGELLSYGASIPEAYRMCGLKITRILKGEKPADLPIEQSTKLILTVNLKAAKALGLEVPASLLARANEVIE